MVSSPSPLATLVGVDILRAGGNAVDAAVAVSAVLLATVPHQCGLGGDAFWLIRPPAGPTLALNASGRSSSTADREHLASLGHRRIPERSAYAVTVPGLTDGWAEALGRFGSREPAFLLRPAIDIAERGAAVTPYLARQLALVDDVLKSRAESARVFRPTGRPLGVGDRLVQVDLAKTLRHIARQPRALYEPPLAERICAAVTDESGWLTVQDLLEHRSEWCEPMEGEYRGWNVLEFPPNSQGWLALVALAIYNTDQSTLSHVSKTDRWIESAKVACRLRDEVLADPGAMSQDARELLDAARAGELGSWAQHQPEGVGATPSRHGAARGGSPEYQKARGDTAHFAIVDRDGLAVSCIQSLYYDFGTGIVVPGTGVVLQNRGLGFRLEAGHPDALAPRKRPLHTLSPGLATSRGELSCVFGAMGGEAQPQIHLQILRLMLDDGLDPAAATAAPRWFVRPDNDGFEVLVEQRHRESAALARLGHRVRRVHAFDELMGHAQVIVSDAARGVLIGAADPRSDGLALGT